MLVRTSAIAWLSAAGLILLSLPWLICMPLGPDPLMYDLQARLVANGGVLYRDILEPNLPGAVWLHLAVRSVAGWSSEALRLADVLLFGCSAWLLMTFIEPLRRDPRVSPSLPGDDALAADSPCRRLESSSVVRPVLLILLMGAYAAASEWCHCQRDLWTLPLVLGALLLRRRALRRPLTSPADDSDQAGSSARPTGRHGAFAAVFGGACLEGLLWGAAVWLKPHVIVPGAAVIAASCLLRWRLEPPQGARIAACEFVGLLVGGLTIGGLGIGWLAATGAWPYLLEVLTDWNPEYLAAAGARWTVPRLLSVLDRLAPFSYAHLLAAPLALDAVVRLRRGSRIAGRTPSRAVPGTMIHEHVALDAVRGNAGFALLSALYLGWAAQALTMQHLFDYVYFPAGVLALGVCAVRASQQWPTGFGELRLAWCVPVVLMVGCLDAPRLAWLPTCLAEGASPRVQAALARMPVTDWRALEQVAEYLESQDVRDGELTVYDTHAIALYARLSKTPATRYVFTETHLRLFPSRAKEIAAALEQSSQRFVVVSLLEGGAAGDVGASTGEAGDDPATQSASQADSPSADLERWRDGLPGDALAAFPYRHPVVFRAGPYLVHRVTGSLGRVLTEFQPLAVQ